MKISISDISVGLSLLAQAKVFGRNGGLYALQLRNNYKYAAITKQLQSCQKYARSAAEPPRWAAVKDHSEAIL